MTVVGEINASATLPTKPPQHLHQLRTPPAHRSRDPATTMRPRSAPAHNRNMAGETSPRGDEEALLRDLYLQRQLPVRLVAEATGLSIGAVARRLTAYGIPTRPPGSGPHHRLSPEVDETLLREDPSVM